MHTRQGLITKAKPDSAELQNNYMPLLTNEVVRTYPNIGSGKTWEQIQEAFRLRRKSARPSRCSVSMRNGRLRRCALTCRPSHMRLRLLALLHVALVRAIDSDPERENANHVVAGARAQQRRRRRRIPTRKPPPPARNGGCADGSAGSQSMRKPPEMTERVSAQTSRARRRRRRRARASAA